MRQFLGLGFQFWISVFGFEVSILGISVFEFQLFESQVFSFPLLQFPCVFSDLPVEFPGGVW